MKEEQEHAQRQENNRIVFNWWKWAFLTLSVIIIAFILYVGYHLQPVADKHSNGSEVRAPRQTDEQAIELTTNIHTDDAEWLMNTYLEQSIEADFASYRIELSDQLELHGTVEFLNFDIPFSLFFSPYVMETGNVQLKAEAVEVGQFSLSVHTVMGLFSEQVDTPSFIAINSEAKYINIYLDQLFEERAFDIAMSRIDLVNDDIQVDLYLTEESISENLKNIEELN